jgi:CDP-diacylglycerol--glycerol-3-phosphate 3-phosphatidyltransferase
MFSLPNLLTLSRIAAIPLVVACFWLDHGWAQWLSAGLFAIACITDWFDGYFARRYHQISRFGRFLDPIADKLLVAAALVSLLTIDKIPAWIVVVIIGRELAVTGLRAVSAGHGVIVPASRLAKWKTVGQYVAVTLLILEKGMVAPGFHALATGVLWVAVALTVVSAIDYFYRFFRKADYRAIVPDEERWS